MRTYAIWGTATSPGHEEWVREIARQFENDEFLPVDDIADADFVLNMFDAADPKAFRRSSRGTYSAAFYELPEAPEDVLKESYPMLVRTPSNGVLLRVPGKGVWFTTMERGTYHVPDDPVEIYERLAPLAFPVHLALRPTIAWSRSNSPVASSFMRRSPTRRKSAPKD